VFRDEVSETREGLEVGEDGGVPGGEGGEVGLDLGDKGVDSGLLLDDLVEGEGGDDRRSIDRLERGDQSAVESKLAARLLCQGDLLHFDGVDQRPQRLLIRPDVVHPHLLDDPEPSLQTLPASSSRQHGRLQHPVPVLGSPPAALLDLGLDPIASGLMRREVRTVLRERLEPTRREPGRRVGVAAAELGKVGGDDRLSVGVNLPRGVVGDSVGRQTGGKRGGRGEWAEGKRL
jgi:hypothetical protein